MNLLPCSTNQLLSTTNAVPPVSAVGHVRPAHDMYQQGSRSREQSRVNAEIQSNNVADGLGRIFQKLVVSLYQCRVCVSNSDCRHTRHSACIARPYERVIDDARADIFARRKQQNIISATPKARRSCRWSCRYSGQQLSVLVPNPKSIAAVTVTFMRLKDARKSLQISR